MTQISIHDFRNVVQNRIKEKHLDYNNNGHIDSDNGELSALLADSGVSDIKQLYSAGKLRETSTNASILSLVFGGGSAALALKTNLLKNASNFVKTGTAVGIGTSLAVSAFFAIKSFITTESKEALVFQHHKIDT